MAQAKRPAMSLAPSCELAYARRIECLAKSARGQFNGILLCFGLSNLREKGYLALGNVLQLFGREFAGSRDIPLWLGIHSLGRKNGVQVNIAVLA
jgi:hypothetical protein